MAIHHIIPLSGDKKQQFAELMVVVIHFRVRLGPQMEQPEIFLQVASFLILLHFLPSITAFFAIIIAYNVFTLQVMRYKILV